MKMRTNKWLWTLDDCMLSGQGHESNRRRTVLIGCAQLLNYISFFRSSKSASIALDAGPVEIEIYQNKFEEVSVLSDWRCQDIYTTSWRGKTDTI